MFRKLSDDSFQNLIKNEELNYENLKDLINRVEKDLLPELKKFKELLAIINIFNYHSKKIL